MKKLQAYNNDEAFRSRVLAEIERHEQLDMFWKGFYGVGKDNGFRGCAIGCTIHSLNLICDTNLYYSSHKDVAELLDVPVELCYLADAIFEHLPLYKSKFFTRRLWSAIRAGADTSDVPRKIKIWILQRTMATCDIFEYQKYEQIKSAFQAVIDTLEGKENLLAVADEHTAEYAAGIAAKIVADSVAGVGAAAAKAVADAFWQELENELVQLLSEA